MKVVINGMLFSSKQAACRHFGVSVYKLHRYYLNTKDSKHIYYVYKGNKFFSLKQVAEASNVKYRTLVDRFSSKKEMLPTKSIDNALLIDVDSITDNYKGRDPKSRVVLKINEVYNGVVYNTIKELSEATGISPLILRRRYSAGFTGAALTYRNNLQTNFKQSTLLKDKVLRTKTYFNSSKVSYTQPGSRKMAEIGEKYDIITLRIKVPIDGAAVKVRNLIT